MGLYLGRRLIESSPGISSFSTFECGGALSKMQYPSDVRPLSSKKFCRNNLREVYEFSFRHAASNDFKVLQTLISTNGDTHGDVGTFLSGYCSVRSLSSFCSTLASSGMDIAPELVYVNFLHRYHIWTHQPFRKFATRLENFGGVSLGCGVPNMFTVKHWPSKTRESVWSLNGLFSGKCSLIFELSSFNVKRQFFPVCHCVLNDFVINLFGVAVTFR